MERQQGTGNGWALSLDDMDVCQLLPLRGDQYDQGVRTATAASCGLGTFIDALPRSSCFLKSGNGRIIRTSFTHIQIIRRNPSFYISKRLYCFRGSKHSIFASDGGTTQEITPCPLTKTVTPKAQLNFNSWIASLPTFDKRSQLVSDHQ